VISSLIVAVGVVSIGATFDEDSNWGVWAFVILLLLLVAMLAVVGHGLVRRFSGALMDSRFRMSLAQFQLAVWSVVVLAAWAAAVFANFGLGVDADAFDVSIPSELWLALGISATSLGGAKLIQSRDVTKPPEKIENDSSAGRLLTERGHAPHEWRSRGALLAHAKPATAGWGDLFAADGVESGAVPDISKIQMFFFTIVLAFGYALYCVDLFATHGSDAITALPALNESFVILLGISQGAYLVKKGVDTLSP
jgi:hypothetical protein